MNKFIIERNGSLSSTIQGFYHNDFGDVHCPGNPNFLYKLKNDPHHDWHAIHIDSAQREFLSILLIDLPEMVRYINKTPLTVCVVPRAKASGRYRQDQLLFKETIRIAVSQLGRDFIDGTDFIERHTDTKTTHLRIPDIRFSNNGRDPYSGIGMDTCHFSEKIRGRDILLIDDIYTKTVNIDEDMIQSLLNCGARSVAFYAVGKTKLKTEYRNHEIYG